MASTRKPKRAERASSKLLSLIAGQLQRAVPNGSRLLVALSGGVDSVVLLDVLVQLRVRHRLALAALHVNHQLQPQAGDWAAFCRALCDDRGVPLRVTRVRVPAGNSVEDAARQARYAVLLKQPVDFVALAHNQDDQAETVMLHLLRGSGVHGLAGMREVTPASRAGATASHTRDSAPKLFRPLLDVPRALIERYARERKLQWIEDPTNAETYFLRNFVRREILSRIETRVPAYRSALSRLVRHAGEAAQLLDELAALDAAGIGGTSGGLPWQRLRAMSEPRAKNLLRFFLAWQGVRVPSAERLNEAVRQIMIAKRDARIRIDLGGAALRRFRDVLMLTPQAPRAGDGIKSTWSGERTLVLDEFGGTLHMKPATGSGISAEKLSTGVVTIRRRRGGERIQPDARRPRRSVKNLLQEARLPPWERERLPFLYCGDDLVWVPGIGIDTRFQAGPQEAGWHPRWTVRAKAAPAPRAATSR